MLTFDEMIAPTTGRREVTIKGLAGSPVLTFDPANATNSRYLDLVLGREEKAASIKEDPAPSESAESAESSTLMALRSGIRQVDELADTLAEACLVSVEADDGAGVRVEYPIEIGRKLLRHVARAAPMAIVELFKVLQKNAGAEIGVDVEAVAGEANGG